MISLTHSFNYHSYLDRKDRSKLVTIVKSWKFIYCTFSVIYFSKIYTVVYCGIKHFTASQPTNVTSQISILLKCHWVQSLNKNTVCGTMLVCLGPSFTYKFKE